MVIGLTVVSPGTSSPELGVNLQPALAGEDGLAIGNACGSGVFTLTFLVGIGAVVTPLVVKQRLVRVDVPILIGEVGDVPGWAHRPARGAAAPGGRRRLLDSGRPVGGAESAEVRAQYERAPEEAGSRSLVPLGRAAWLVALGLAGLIAGGRWMLEGAAQMAHALGVDELIIGLTAVAIGTGLPEVAATFSVVLFTILFQSQSMDGLLRRLGIIERSKARHAYERRQARAMASRAAYEHLKRTHRVGLTTDHTWDPLRGPARRRLQALTHAVQEGFGQAPEMGRQELAVAEREALPAQRARLRRLRREGALSYEGCGELAAEVDPSLVRREDPAAQGASASPVRTLAFVLVQGRDLKRATNALSSYGARCTLLSSRGGFLGQSGHLLLVGLGEGRLPGAMRLLEQVCRTRVEYVTAPLEAIPGPMPAPIAVQVRGATVFAFDVERHEEIGPCNWCSRSWETARRAKSPAS